MSSVPQIVLAKPRQQEQQNDTQGLEHIGQAAMSIPSHVWDNVADVWEAFEDDGTTVRDIASVRPWVSSPTLVVGAGQGLIVHALREWGYEVCGLDASARMARYAKQRRGLRIIIARGDAIPYGDATFPCVIIPTGVLEADRPERMVQTLHECRRVMQAGGNLITGFPMPDDDWLLAAEEVGYVANRFQHWRRIVALWIAGPDPIAQAELVAKWTDRTAEEARRIVKSHGESIRAMAVFLDYVASFLTSHGKQSREFLQETATFDHQFFRESDIRKVLQDTGLVPIHWTRGASRMTVTVVSRMFAATRHARFATRLRNK